jgi:hypothetical protein
VEEYYGEKVKATEYPKKIIDVHYNKYGYLERIVDGRSDYRFKYDHNGELLSGNSYDVSTGKLLSERDWHKKLLSKECGFVYYDSKPYLIYWWMTPYFTYDSSPFLLNILYKDGISGCYYAFRANKMGEKMHFRKEYIGLRKKQLKDIAPFWRDYDADHYKDRYVRYYIEKNFYEYNYETTYNEIGLKIGEGVTLSESKSYAVKNNKYYEYHWLNY